mgnify:CR=1 FL=1
MTTTPRVPPSREDEARLGKNNQIFLLMSHKSAFQSWTRFDQNRIFFHISISCLNWDWGKVKNERRREGDKAADLNFAWSSFLLFFSPSSYEKKVGRWSVANECKVLIPLQFSLMMNTMPTGQIFFKSMMFFCKEKKKLYNKNGQSMFCSQRDALWYFGCGFGAAGTKESWVARRCNAMACGQLSITFSK